MQIYCKKKKPLNLFIEFLPKSLISAISALEKDSLMEEVLGEHTYKNFIENKRLEYAEYHREVHEWEIQKYIQKY